MRNPTRKAVVRYNTTPTRTTNAALFRELNKRRHKHTCTDQRCRLTYEDGCLTAERNERCPHCRGQRRTWLLPDGTAWKDPAPCCADNCVLMSDVDDLLRYECAGPGPWYRCLTCHRTHGHPCTDPHLLNRPHEIAHQRGTP